jgi:transposase
MGPDHGRTPEENAGPLPYLPHGYPTRTPTKTHGITFTDRFNLMMLESWVRGNPHAQFGGGQLEKGVVIPPSLAGYPTLFDSKVPREQTETSRSLPEEIRQLIVDLHREMPTMSWREIAEICFIRTGRKPSHHSVKHIAISGSPPPLMARRYQLWHQIPDPAERKLAVIRLHAEGWSISSIGSYLEVSRPTIYATLKRWTEEGVAGLEEKSRARKGPRKVTLQIRNAIRKLQENPLLGEWRVHAALLRMGIEVSPATCGRIMAANRGLYGLEKPKRQPREKLEMPFRASHRALRTGAQIFATSKNTCCLTRAPCM